jgi:hypothetical protein
VSDEVTTYHIPKGTEVAAVVVTREGGDIEISVRTRKRLRDVTPSKQRELPKGKSE